MHALLKQIKYYLTTAEMWN